MKALLTDTMERALSFLDELPERKVANAVDVAALREALGGALPEDGAPAQAVLASLDDSARPALVANVGPRFFGFVIGGVHPIALAADWLVSTWDQNHGLNVLSPAASVAEETAGRWIVELLGLPPRSSVAFVTGGQMANFTALAAARHELLRVAGWDVETRDVIARVQRDGTCWLGGTAWKGSAAMRISIINATTTERDVDRSAQAILGCFSESISERPRPE